MERGIRGDSSAGICCFRQNRVAMRERLTRDVFEVIIFSLGCTIDLSVVYDCRKMKGSWKVYRLIGLVQI